MSNYSRINFILSHSMNERDNYAERICINVGTFKADAHSNLVHMHILVRLSKPPFHHCQRNGEDSAEASLVDSSQGVVGAINNAAKEAESSRKR